jgi:hypothetical protein
VGFVVAVKGVQLLARYKLPLNFSYSYIQNKLNLSVLNSHFDLSCTEASSRRQQSFGPSRVGHPFGI